MDIFTALICDMIRQEDNGKYLMVGVYSGGIVVQDFPAVIPFALMLQVRLPPGVEHKFKMRVSVAGNVAGNVEGNVQQTGNPGEVNWIPLSLPPLTFPGPGDLKAEYELPDGSWKECFSIAIQAGQQASEPA